MPSCHFLTRLLAALVFIAGTVVSAVAQRSDFGTITIQVRPPDADVLVDGERWVSPANNALVIQLLPGVHRVELRAPGRRPYVSDVTVRAGENVPLNVALPQGGPEPPPPPPRTSPFTPQPPNPIVQTTSTQDGFVFAPDVKITEINHETSTLVGAYGGWVFGGQFLIGAGGYWQANDTFGTHLTYGGPVLEWRFLPTNTIGVNLHGLIGGGYRYADYYPVYPVEPTPFGGRNGRYYGYPYYYRDDAFFVVEPEAQVVFRFGSMVRLQTGIGYRATSASGLNGASGSISVQFGR